MKSNNSPAGNAGTGGLGWLLAILGVVLLVLFHNSLVPDRVFFSNDGPLGSMNTRSLAMPSAFMSVWNDLNWLGQNSGSFLLPITGGILWLFGPVGYAKFDAAIVLFLLGCSAGLFFRQMRLAPVACVLGALAAALNSEFFSTACWGVATHQVAIATAFLAMAAAGASDRPAWIRLPLAGLAVGLGVVEAADVGAIFSLFVAAYVLFQAYAGEGSSTRRTVLGVTRVGVVAAFAVFIAVQTIQGLIATSITGVVGAEQTKESKSERWDWATQWSLPKREALAIVVPGLFGYRMDTPMNLPGSLQDAYAGGNYWGAIGRDPAWYRYFESGREGPPPGGFMRQVGGGIYAGVLVVLIALWSGFQSLRKDTSVFSPDNRKFVRFWLVIAVVTLLLAFGRHAPFYQLLYALPYSSTIRNPAKFLHVTSWALVILFAYGIHGLNRRYLEAAAVATGRLTEHLRTWWAKVKGFDRNWVVGCVLTIGASLLGWLVYASARTKLVEYLQTVQFDEGTAKTIASFSFRQVGWFILFLLLSVGLVAVVLSGWFAGRRAKWGGILLGVLLVADLGRANLPWLIYWNYKEKYAANPVIERLREAPYEHRVAIVPDLFQRIFRLPQELLNADGFFRQLYEIEWKQHLFLYYNIQCLDIVQMPRVPTDFAAFEGALRIRFTQDNAGRVMIVPESLSLPARHWQLTNTRYLLGPAGYVDLLNQQIDPTHKSFRIAERFQIVPKANIARPTKLEELTAVSDTNGPYALIEFTGALPRGKLYSQWQVSTNDTATLAQLAIPAFDPIQKVLIADEGKLPVSTAATNANAGTVEFVSYAPKNIALRVKAETPAVLLLNDKFDPNWKVLVDGKPEPLLRANYIMRGVFVQPGNHTVEFKFEPRITALYVSLSAMGLGVILIGCLLMVPRLKRLPNEHGEGTGDPANRPSSKAERPKSP